MIEIEIEIVYIHYIVENPRKIVKNVKIVAQKLNQTELSSW